ncbi:Stress response protein NST1 [Spathaspora sp. JA1]|nr:Stress response protein NST1 [Spathaspora sp. JA1]
MDTVDANSSSSRFKLGDDIHFDYNTKPDQKSNSVVNESSTTKKKKKKKTRKQISPSISNVNSAHLNNPDEDYPTSRVIKQAPNGDVIVESLDDEENTHAPASHTNLWDSSSIEEQEKLKEFWESLDEASKLDLVKIDKKSIMEMFRNETRRQQQSQPQQQSQQHQQPQQQSQTHSHHDHATTNGPVPATAPPANTNNNTNTTAANNSTNNTTTNSCACKYCGRKNNLIEDELENIYDNHFDDIIDFIHEVRDINDLNALPGLLFGGFHMLEEEHKLQKRQLQFNQKLELMSKQQAPTKPQQPTQLKEGLDESKIINQEISTTEQQIFNKLLDPKLYEALENMDLDKLKQQDSNVSQANLLEKANSLRQIVRDLHKTDKDQLEKGINFLTNIGKLFPKSNPSDNNQQHDQLTQGLSNFAEDLLKNDGNSFINMMEALSEARNGREGLLKDDITAPVLTPAWEDEDDKCQQEESDYEDYEDEDDDEEDDEEDEDEEDEDILEDVSDPESEISEEEKMQEIRRLFLIQVIKLFQERLKNAYKEKISQDRTQKLIEELEAEEEAKKERELKKLKQKEKAKEKKRLLQLAKEEEKRKREEEEKAKQEEIKLKQEALKADQRRRKEEARLKREEEKRKRIEELKKKEEEHKKKVEAQQKREEEAKRLKEERRKKLEEERKQKEEEKKQRELVKKQKEEERERARIAKEEEEAAAAAAAAAEAEAEAEAIAQESTISSNHLLNQLYHAKPSSISSSSTSIGQQSVTNAPPVLSPLPQLAAPPPPINPPALQSYTTNDPFMSSASYINPAGTNMMNSPQVSSNALMNSGNVPTVVTAPVSTTSPWSSKSRINSLSGQQQQQQPIFPQFAQQTTSTTIETTGAVSATSTNFSPFNAFSDPLSSEPFMSTPIVVPNSGNNTNNIWNPGSATSGATTRNSSIWGTITNTASTGGVSAAVAAPTTSNPTNNPAPMNSNNGIWGGNGLTSKDIELIQASSFSCFQMLQSTNQLEFGVVSIIKLFQDVVNMIKYPGLTINQYLSCCMLKSSIYQFDFIYDDFGTVTHVKVGLVGFARTSPPPQQSLVPPPGLTKTSPFNDNSLLSTIGELNATTTTGNNIVPSTTTNTTTGFGRRLWN